MGKINTVDYEVLTEDHDFNKKYWYDNVTLYTDKIDNEYIDYLKEDNRIKNKYLHNIKDKLKGDSNYKAMDLRSVIYGLSPFTNRNILIVDIE